jgi:hypothetical protein
LTSANTPTATITTRSASGGSLRPTRAPIWPPMVEPIAMRTAARQSTCATNRKSTAATPLTMAASTFLVALLRCMVSCSPMPSTAISKTPCAAPKYPP